MEDILKLQLNDTALMIRHQEDNKYLILGLTLEMPEGAVLFDNEEHLILGTVEINIKHAFKEWKHINKGDDPNDMLKQGCLSHENYKHKIL